MSFSAIAVAASAPAPHMRGTTVKGRASASRWRLRPRAGSVQHVYPFSSRAYGRLVSSSNVGRRRGLAPHAASDGLTASIPSESEPITVDEALTLVGEFGPAQQRLCALCCACWIPLAMHAISPVFTTVAMKAAGLWGVHTAPWMLSAMDSAFFTGFLGGAFCFGGWSDARGRRPALLAALALCLVAGTVCAGCATFVQFLIARVLVGLAVGGLVHTSFVLATECVGSGARHYLGTLFNAAWVLGCLGVSGTAYAIPQWRQLLLAFSFPLVVLLAFVWHILPESPRWLLQTQGTAPAMKELQKLADINGTQWPEMLKLQPVCATADAEEDVGDNKACTIWKEVSWRTTLSLMAGAYTISLVFYGLTLDVGTVPGSLHANACVSALAELPAYLAAAPLMKSPLGRVGSTAGALLLAGLALFAALAVQAHSPTATQALFLLAKTCVTLGFATIFTCAAEVFPTSVRNSGMAIMRVVDGLGGASAPMFLLLGATAFKAAPHIAFALVALTSGALCLLNVPETKDAQMV